MSLMVFSLKPLLLHLENDVKVSSTYPNTCTYVWQLGRESMKAKAAQRVFQARGQVPSSHGCPPRAEGASGWAGAYTPHRQAPQPALSSMQPFLLFLWSVFSQHFYCFSGLWQLCTAGCLLSCFFGTQSSKPLGAISTESGASCQTADFDLSASCSV